ncbi:unnamed protein product [Pedinophyceae sp. YPF-701]|nr:unnamed protein product [Pedinophyceae sp. YPF-701]
MTVQSLGSTRAPRSASRAASHRRSRAVAARASKRAVVVLPGLGNNAKDYDGLADLLRDRLDVHVDVAQVARLDWARNAAGLVDPNYWKGTLKPRPTVNWYLKRTEAAVKRAREATDGGPVTLLAHSAGGWMGRLYMMEYHASLRHGVDAFVSLGSPHLPPPEGVIDQTRGILTYLSEACGGCADEYVAYTTVAGRFLKGAALGDRGASLQRIVVGAGYQQVCGDARAWGDGITPVETAHLPGAAQINIDAVYHSPLGEGPDRQWYGHPRFVPLWEQALMPGRGVSKDVTEVATEVEQGVESAAV